MELTILGSGGCAIIPKPLCRCRVCAEAREKGAPFARTGPSVFLHDENILIDTPAEISCQLNRSRIESLDYLLFSHLDPDHTEGFRIVEQIAIDFRTWKAFPEKQTHLVLPRPLLDHFKRIKTVYGSQLDFFRACGFVKCSIFDDKTNIGNLTVTAIPVDRGDQVSFIYAFEKRGRKIVYAPCDIKPFPENRDAVKGADLFVVQPGIFENGLASNFVYPSNHVSRTTLYTFEETLDLAKKIRAERVLFIHLEEYWNRSYSDYRQIEKQYGNICFAYDGMRIAV